MILPKKKTNVDFFKKRIKVIACLRCKMRFKQAMVRYNGSLVKAFASGDFKDLHCFIVIAEKKKIKLC